MEPHLEQGNIKVDKYCKCGKLLGIHNKSGLCRSCKRKEFLKKNPQYYLYNLFPEGYWKDKERIHNSDCTCCFCNSKKEGFVPWNKNIPMKEETKKLISKALNGFKPSKETRIKIGIASKKAWEDSVYRAKQIKERKDRYLNEEYRNKHRKNSLAGMRKRPTKPEKIIKKLLNKLFPKEYQYTGNGKIIINGFNPDFVHKKNKKIIEVYGDYWHNLLNVKEKDLRKLKTYEERNYKTLIIWQSELEDLNKVSKRIIEFND